jgi:hypothetical protein
VDQKALLESRDETIVKLHARLSQLESPVKKNPLTSLSHPVRVRCAVLLHAVFLVTWFGLAAFRGISAFLALFFLAMNDE